MDAVEAKQAVRVAGLIQGPVYVRLSKYDLPLITSESDSLTLGKARQFSSGNQVSVFVSGAMTSYALRAVLELSARYSIDMWSFTSIKPVDEDAIVRSASKTNLVLTIEDHQINAGFGSLVTEVLAGKRPTKVIRHGVYDTFGESGSIEDILHKYRLDSGGIKTEIIKVIEEGV
jgi:transketolase